MTRLLTEFRLPLAKPSLTAGISTIERAAGINAGNKSNGICTPEIIPYSAVADATVNPVEVNAFKKTIGSKNQVNDPNNLLPCDGSAIRKILL